MEEAQLTQIYQKFWQYAARVKLLVGDPHGLMDIGCLILPRTPPGMPILPAAAELHET